MPLYPEDDVDDGNANETCEHGTPYALDCAWCEEEDEAVCVSLADGSCVGDGCMHALRCARCGVEHDLDDDLCLGCRYTPNEVTPWSE